MKKETVQKFVEAYSGNDLARDLANFIANCADLKAGRDRLNQSLRQIVEEYRTKESRWKTQCRTLQASCPHPEIEHIYPPTGGSDSYDQCTLCGKEF